MLIIFRINKVSKIYQIDPKFPMKNENISHLSRWLFIGRFPYFHDFSLPLYLLGRYTYYKTTYLDRRLSTGENFIHVYLEIWDKGILKFNKLSM